MTPVSDTTPPTPGSELKPIPIKEEMSGKLIGPIAIGGRLSQGGRALDLESSYTYSAIIVCDWLSRSDQWDRRKLVTYTPLNCRPDAVADIQMSAWLCSMAHYIAEDGGWAVDWWDARAIRDDRDPQCCYVEATIAIALRGKCAKLNRVGYTWTAYTGHVPVQR